MKVLKKGRLHGDVWPKEIACPECRALLEVDQADCSLSTINHQRYTFTCPECQSTVGFHAPSYKPYWVPKGFYD